MKLSGSKKRLFTRQFWRSINFKHYILFLLAVFFTFSSLGFVSDLLSNLRFSYPDLALAVFTTGLFSTGYAYSATKNLWLLPLFIIVQMLYMLVFRPNLGEIEMSASVQEFKARVNAMGIMFSVILGYTFFVTFITKVGINHFLMSAEMNLAKSIHEVLVPDIQLSRNNFDIAGKSIPTSEVGGDMIDVFESENQIFCTIADVSGHGVSSGVYTGMFKSSLRTILQSDQKVSDILQTINQSLQPLMKKSMFITSAMIRFDQSNKVEYSLAGHLPILHFDSSSNSFNEHLIRQIPLGMKSDFNFSSSEVVFKEGDIFVLITDGITETVNKKNEEFGIDRVKSLVKENRTKSAKEISNIIFDQVTSFGNQKDDITLLVVKC